MNFFKGNFKFIIILLLVFFGGAIINIVDNFDYNENKTGIIYQENENIALSELNKTYDYNINYNLSQSYLHYVPVKKNGLLDNYHKYTSKNLASPDLTGKEYLGNGDYKLSKYRIYNLYSGLYSQINTTDNFITFLIVDLEPGVYTVSYTKTDGRPDFIRYTVNGISSFSSSDLFQIEVDVRETYRFAVWEDVENNVSFKFQIEQGTTVTSYTVPYIPAFKIDFNGSNQVEYINPYEEQTIKINDINNVNNIEFELLNVINPVVFNWNITTNPNIPFVKFYNNKTKLLYDFTDIREINNIGNELMGSRSNFSVVFGGVFELIDMFYSGFQKLFNNSVIRNIFDNLKTVPSIVGNWFWFKGGIN